MNAPKQGVAIDDREGLDHGSSGALEHFSFRLNRNESSKSLSYRVSDPRTRSGEQKWYPLLLETL